MIIIDRLSSRMGIDYMDMFHKTEQYQQITTQAEPEKLKEVFNETEKEFLACVALEYLRIHGMNKPGDIGKIRCPFISGEECPYE